MNNEKNGLVVELADTSALRADDESHGGSNPSEPTTYVEWKQGMSASEQLVEVGQERIVFIDSFGFLQAKILSIHQNHVQVQIDELNDNSIHDVDWSCLGILTNGECMVEVQERLCHELELMSSKIQTNQ